MKRVNEARKQAGLTYGEMAIELGITETSLRNKLNGRAKLSLVEGIRIKRIINTHLGDEIYTVESLFT